MGNGALPHGPSYRAHPRLYLPGRKLRYTKWLNLRQLLELSGREMGCGSEDFGLKMTQLGLSSAKYCIAFCRSDPRSKPLSTSARVCSTICESGR
jgi:hypothetical protein